MTQPVDGDDYRQWWGRPQVVLASAMAVYVAYFARHLVLRHERFGTFDYDLGIWDQYVWLWAHGESFNTIRGLDNLAFHVSPSLAVFVPFYWLGAGPTFLNAAMVLSVAAGAVPVYRLGRHLLDDEWLPIGLAAAYLGHFSLQWQMWETFHPETLAIGPLLFGYEAVFRRRWLPGAAWLVFAVGLKEDIALAVAMIGVLVALRGQWRRGGAVFGLSVVWFFVCTKLVMPQFSDAGVFYEQFYGYLGDGPVAMADTAVTNPTEYTRQLEQADAVGYTRDLLLPFGFLPLLSPLTLLVAVPQVLANLLSLVPNSWPVRVHYAAVPIAVMAMASVHGVARLRRPALRRVAVGWMCAASLATSSVWGISRFSPDYDNGFWPLFPDPVNEVRAEVAAAVPDGAAVAASYNLSPHLTHRREAYTFPSPWLPHNWGVAGEDLPSPDRVDWLAVDLAVTSEEHRALLDEILAADDWELVSDEAGVILARRR